MEMKLPSSDVASDNFQDSDDTVEVSANVQASPTPQISLTWPRDNDPSAYGYIVERSLAGSNEWTRLNSIALNATSTGFTDTTADADMEYQYQVIRLQVPGSQQYAANATGYIDSGIDLTTSDTQGTIELIVDNNSQFLPIIAPQSAQFEQALIGAGWAINLHDVSESDSPTRHSGAHPK